MKVLTKKNFAAFALTGLLTVTCAGLMGNGTVAESDKDIVDTAMISSTMSSCAHSGRDTVAIPQLAAKAYNLVATEKNSKAMFTYYESYNCFVAYPIVNTDQYATELYFGVNNGSAHEFIIKNVGYNEVTRYIQVAKYDDVCRPSQYIVSAYCESCRQVSYENATMINDYNDAYDAVCAKGCTNYMTSETIKTSYTNDNRFAHGGSKGDTVYFSIAYNGSAGGTVTDNFTVTVPGIGYRYSSTVSVGGVDFTVRVGPTYLYVKASSTVICDGQKNVFAFYTETE